MAHLSAQVEQRVEVLGRQAEDINRFDTFNPAQTIAALGSSIQPGKCTAIAGIPL